MEAYRRIGLKVNKHKGAIMTLSLGLREGGGSLSQRRNFDSVTEA